MEDPIVELDSGHIRGVVETHEDGFNYYAFRGIPYAEPPVGELRFKDPIPKKPWTGEIDCSNYSPICLQSDYLLKRSSSNEDCLHLNVFTRSINRTNETNPVIFVIHAGGFIFGSSDDHVHGPDYMIRKNIVLVTINYRLGVLGLVAGFLHLDDEVAPGNQGLKDQLMALQWVQQNIRQFGGDPGNVTVLGISVGGVTAHYLSLSPLSKGLFHKVISHSGVIFHPWTTIINSKLNAIKLCSFLGKELTDSREIFQFLKNVDATKLQEAVESLTELIKDSLPFGPGIDDKSPNPVMPIDPAIAAIKGVHLPFLTGYNSHEGILLLKGLSSEEYFKKCDMDFGTTFKYNMDAILSQYNLTKTQVKKFYYKNERISNENKDIYVNLVTDFMYGEAIHRFARVQVEQSSAPTYLYLFSYDTPDSLSKRLYENAPNGAAHFDELPYFFKMRAIEEMGMEHAKKGTRKYKMMEQVTEMWTNFARFGMPTIDTTELTPVYWTPVRNGTVLRFLNIDENITMQSMINLDQKFLAIKNIVE